MPKRQSPMMPFSIMLSGIPTSSATTARPNLGHHSTVLNLGCALPWGHVEPYMHHGATTGWWWGIYELLIQGGQITDFNAISMLELERRYKK